MPSPNIQPDMINSAFPRGLLIVGMRIEDAETRGPTYARSDPKVLSPHSCIHVMHLSVIYGWPEYKNTDPSPSKSTSAIKHYEH